MESDVISQLRRTIMEMGPERRKYTAKAFSLLPKLVAPKILDIGCGTGGPTLELARLSQGLIVAVDIHQPSIDTLIRKARTEGFSNRVEAINCSMFDMRFPDESFDVIWSEGSIHAIGLERGLKEWKRFLKLEGFLAVHDMVWLQPDPPQEIREYWRALYPGIKTIRENLMRISHLGYTLIGSFQLPGRVWWNEYYGPLEKRLKKLRIVHSDSPKVQALLESEEREITLYRLYHEWYGSAFFIMQK